METALFHLIFHVATPRLTHVVKHFAEHPFERIIANLTALLARSLHRLVAVIGNIKRGALHVAAVLGSVAIVGTQLLHILLRAQDAGDDNLVKRYALDLQTVEKRAADVL